MKLIMTKGLPASGKTTWAKQQNAYRVNKDDLRSMMNNGIWSKINERYILLIRDSIIEIHLKDGNDVIVDDTNLSPKHEVRLRELAELYNAEFEIKDFTDVPLDECIKRDQKRPNYVGEKVIKQMYNQYLKPKIEPITFDAMLPLAIVCDLDGTLCLFGDKNPYDRDFLQDNINIPVLTILEMVKKIQLRIILVSGRNNKYRTDTELWLFNEQVPYDELYMERNPDDSRKDVTIKTETYEKYIKNKFNVLFVLDDRNQVVDLWRSLGLTCFQVAEGSF